MARAAQRAGREAQSTGLLVAALLAAAGCANQGPPPGGPPDTAPPSIVRIEPESGAVAPGWKGDAVIHFDEVIEEMPDALAKLVLLSPVAGDVQVSWGRTRIRVKPKEGWKGNRVYRLQLLPGVVDLRRNKLDSGRVVLFSTGPEIGHATLAGRALQWVEQRTLARALIEAIPLPDTVGYLTLADSAGRFALAALRPGRYLVYASADANTNHRRDAREPYDSALVTLDSNATLALFTFVHDSVGPRPRTVTAIDSVTARIDFSQALNPAVTLDTSRIAVRQLPDSSPVALRAVLTQRQYDSLAAAERAAAKPDTGAARADSAVRLDTAVSPGAPRGEAPKGAAGDTVVARDTAEVHRLLAQRPVPFDKVVLRFVRPLPPETRYVVLVHGAANLNGATADGLAVLTMPKPVARDTTRNRPRTTPKPP
ncbi:MAG TPA: carboxypeptidase-like regulatory domain-containing protein [Gemmatimonadales bacterium]